MYSKNHAVTVIVTKHVDFTVGTMRKQLSDGKTARGLIFHFRSSDILVDGARTFGCCNRCCIERWIARTNDPKL